jgi:hypothetical protein
MLPGFRPLVKNSWLRIGDIVSLSDLLVSSERANFLEADFRPTAPPTPPDAITAQSFLLFGAQSAILQHF